MSVVIPQMPPDAEVIEFISKGQITIPKHLRDEYHIEPGQKGMLIPISGAMILIPHPSKTSSLFDQISAGLGTEDMSLEEMVEEMRRIRESNNYEA